MYCKMRICITKVVCAKQCEKSIKKRQKKTNKPPESTELQWPNERMNGQPDGRITTELTMNSHVKEIASA